MSILYTLVYRLVNLQFAVMKKCYKFIIVIWNNNLIPDFCKWTWLIHSHGTLMWIILSNRLTTTIDLLQLCRPFPNGQNAINFYDLLILWYVAFTSTTILRQSMLQTAFFFTSDASIQNYCKYTTYSFHLFTTSDRPSHLKQSLTPWTDKLGLKADKAPFLMLKHTPKY